SGRRGHTNFSRDGSSDVCSSDRSYQLSLRGPGKKYGGDDDSWARAESLLRDALADAGVAYAAVPGEAAFYGPKIDIQVADPSGQIGSACCRALAAQGRKANELHS